MRHHRDSIYSCYTSQGMDSPIWKAKGWTMTAMLASFIQDDTQSAEDRDYAASILRWCNRELDENGWPLIGHTHDEPLLEVDEGEDEECKAVLLDIMTHPPAWAAGLPLRAEVNSGFVYGK